MTGVTGLTTAWEERPAEMLQRERDDAIFHELMSALEVIQSMPQWYVPDDYKEEILDPLFWAREVAQREAAGDRLIMIDHTDYDEVTWNRLAGLSRWTNIAIWESHLPKILSDWHSIYDAGYYMWRDYIGGDVAKAQVILELFNKQQADTVEQKTVRSCANKGAE